MVMEGGRFYTLDVSSHADCMCTMRRVCPGMYLANDSLFITFALLLWSFRIFERPDAPIDPDAYTDTLISRPFPFEVDFVPRMDEKLLRMTMGPEGDA